MDSIVIGILSTKLNIYKDEFKEIFIHANKLKKFIQKNDDNTFYLNNLRIILAIEI